MWVRIETMFGRDDACDADCESFGTECFELDLVSFCRWQGAGPQGACFGDSTLTADMTCDGTNTTIVLTWTFTNPAGDTETVRWDNRFQDLPDPVNCTDCFGNFYLDVVQNGTTCNTTLSFVKVDFQEFAGCCDTCPASYNVTITGASDLDPGTPCIGTVCDDLNGVYQVDFLGSDRTPNRTECGNWSEGNWCEWAITGLNIRCGNTDHGFCEIHLFLRASDDCKTFLILELWEDFEADPNHCTSPDARLAWWTTIDGNCRNIDVIMGIANVCVDQTAICSPDAISVRVQSP